MNRFLLLQCLLLHFINFKARLNEGSLHQFDKLLCPEMTALRLNPSVWKWSGKKLWKTEPLKQSELI